MNSGEEGPLCLLIKSSPPPPPPLPLSLSMILWVLVENLLNDLVTGFIDYCTSLLAPRNHSYESPTTSFMRSRAKALYLCINPCLWLKILMEMQCNIIHTKKLCKMSWFGNCVTLFQKGFTRSGCICLLWKETCFFLDKQNFLYGWAFLQLHRVGLFNLIDRGC